MDKQERIQLVRDIKAIINNELDLKKDSTDEEIEDWPGQYSRNLRALSQF